MSDHQRIGSALPNPNWHAQQTNINQKPELAHEVATEQRSAEIHQSSQGQPATPSQGQPATPSQGQLAMSSLWQPATPSQGQYAMPPSLQSARKSSLEQIVRQPQLAETLLALVTLALGFCFWEWQLWLPFYYGIGLTLFFLLAIVAGAVYMRVRSIRQTPASLVALVAAVLGSAVFALNGQRDINWLLAIFEGMLCLFWLACACKTLVATRLTGVIAADALSQLVAVPLANFTSLFRSLFNRQQSTALPARDVLATPASAATAPPSTATPTPAATPTPSAATAAPSAAPAPAPIPATAHPPTATPAPATAAAPTTTPATPAAPGKSRRAIKLVGFCALGLLAASPVAYFVLQLLVSSDSSFALLISDFTRWLREFDITQLTIWSIEFLFGIPIACYVFGSLYGNVLKQHTVRFQEQTLVEKFERSHLIPRPAAYAFLGLMLLIYLVYIAAMAGYLFGALFEQLPVGYSYAGYARRGFFELCGVAVINSCILGATWWLVQRQNNTRPPVLLLLSAIITLVTILLVLIAISKMLLYVGSYDLTPLRLYTLWFMVLLLVCFSLLLVWHIRRFNAARIIVIAGICATLALGLVNTNAVIANYNVSSYLDGHNNPGQSRPIDVAALRQLGPAASPALQRLIRDAPDAYIRHEAESIPEQGMILFGGEWYNQSLQDWIAQSVE